MNATSYIKMLLHAAKYPHCPVNGILVRKKTGNSSAQIKNCIPLFHLNLTLLPMLEVALAQIEAYCEQENLAICGYYHIYSDASYKEEHKIKPRPDSDLFIYKLMERLEENCGKVSLFMLDNSKLNIEDHEVPYTNYELKDNKLVPVSSVSLESGAVELASKAIQAGQYQSLVDFDNHLDDVSLDWRNEHLDR